MLFELQSTKPLQELDAALKAAVAKHKFGVLGVIDLKQKMSDKGVEFNRDCLVYEVCNPLQAKKVLEANGAISTALPCRISIYGEPGAYRVATLLPTAVMTMFETPGIGNVAEEVEQAIVAMIREAV